MKKATVWSLIVTVLVLAACGAQTTSLDFVFDGDGNYTGFENIPTDLSQNEMTVKGYVIQSGLDIIANEEEWTRFVEISGGGKDASVRIVNLADEGPYYTDLFYKDGYYYLFDSTAETKDAKPFRYLLTLEGQFGSSKRDTTAVVLTDDDKLTLEDILNAMISSNMDDIRNVSPYRLVMFL